MEEKQSRTVAILDPINLQEIQVQAEQTLGIAHIPLKALKANIEATFADIVEMFKSVEHSMGSCQVAHVDLSLGLAMDGSVGIFGSKLGAEAKGGIKVRLIFKQ